MKRGIKTTVLLSALFLGTTAALAQAGLKKSEKEYHRWAYVEAMDIYEKIVKRGYVSQDLMEKLGDTYYFNARYAEAQPYYERDRKSTRLNSSHVKISYAVFCLKK